MLNKFDETKGVKHWMERRGMAIVCFVGYPIMFPLLNIIGFCVEKRFISFSQYNKIAMELYYLK